MSEHLASFSQYTSHALYFVPAFLLSPSNAILFFSHSDSLALLGNFKFAVSEMLYALAFDRPINDKDNNDNNNNRK